MKLIFEHNQNNNYELRLCFQFIDRREGLDYFRDFDYMVRKFMFDNKALFGSNSKLVDLFNGFFDILSLCVERLYERGRNFVTYMDESELMLLIRILCIVNNVGEV